MYRREKDLKENRYIQTKKSYPSFSSSLLDKIYKSIDEPEPNNGEDMRFYKENIGRKQNKYYEDDPIEEIKEACLVEKRVGPKMNLQKKQISQENVRKSRKSVYDYDLDHDQDRSFFSSSSSSDSSSNGFSSSECDSIYGVKTRNSSGPKPIRTSVSKCPSKTERTLFHEQNNLHMFHDYKYHYGADQTPGDVENIIKSKSRALKIYANLKKVKQPISPGGKLASFISSLFAAAGTPKKAKTSSSSGGYDEVVSERNSKSSGSASMCSSASSFSRSCLSKNSPSRKGKSRGGAKRSVTFDPVSVIVDEDCRPCGHKPLYEDQTGINSSNLIPISLPRACENGRSNVLSRGNVHKEEIKAHFIEKSRRVEEAAREILKDYHRYQKKKNNSIPANTRGSYGIEEEDDDDDDDAASYSSSDLFELDHHTMMGIDRYIEELPVYETTNVSTNRAIANGLIM